MVPSDDFEDCYADLLAVAQRAAARIVARDTAADVASEAVARAWMHWDRLDASAARRWVVRVATNLAIDEVRRLRRGRDLADPPVAGSFVDELVERDAVAAAVGLLPRRQRDAVVLRHVAGMSQLEIAAAFGVARSTAAVHLARGEATLRARLADPDHNKSPDHKKRRRRTMQVTTIEQAIDAMATGSVIEGTVTGLTDHGLDVDIGIPALMPRRLVDSAGDVDLAPFAGAAIACVVRGVSAERGVIIVSRLHAVASDDERAARRAWFAGLAPGDELPGVVSSAVAFGWFIDLEGGSGLVHVSETGDAGLELGQRITVEVLAVDAAAERISLRPV